MLSGAYNYLKQTVRKESDGDLSNIMDYFKNIEKYLSFDSGVVVSIPYLGYYPKIFYDIFHLLVGHDDSVYSCHCRSVIMIGCRLCSLKCCSL